MDIKSFVFNPFYENTYLLIGDNKDAFIVDPGCYEVYEKEELTNYIASNELNPIAVVNTHCHIDHVLGNLYLTELYKIPLWIPAGEVDMLRSMEVYAPTWGITNYGSKMQDKTLTESDELTLGSEKLSIRLAPGHSPGHLMFYHQESKSLIAGDVIFRESIGRTDLPGGSFETLEQSIKTQVYTLPDDVVIFPGHGPTTEVGYEKANNPFVKA